LVGNELYLLNWEHTREESLATNRTLLILLDALLGNALQALQKLVADALNLPRRILRALLQLLDHAVEEGAAAVAAHLGEGLGQQAVQGFHLHGHGLQVGIACCCCCGGVVVVSGGGGDFCLVEEGEEGGEVGTVAVGD